MLNNQREELSHRHLKTSLINSSNKMVSNQNKKKNSLESTILKELSQKRSILIKSWNWIIMLPRNKSMKPLESYHLNIIRKTMQVKKLRKNSNRSVKLIKRSNLPRRKILENYPWVVYLRISRKNSSRSSMFNLWKVNRQKKERLKFQKIKNPNGVNTLNHLILRLFKETLKKLWSKRQSIKTVKSWRFAGNRTPKRMERKK